MDFTLPNTIAVLMGLSVPALIGWLKQKITSSNWRFALAIGLSALIGVLSAIISKTPFDPTHLAVYASVVIGYGQTAYNIWKQLFVKK